MDSLNRTYEMQPEYFEFSGEMGNEVGYLAEMEMPFSESEELELAYELLEVTSEAELEQFLGKLFKKAWRGIKSVGSKLIRPLGGVLKSVAKTALPFLATAAGTFFGGPAGGAIAGKLGSLVSQALEAETANVLPQDRDLEKCRKFVRMAGKAAKAAALAPSNINPITTASNLLANTAKEKLLASSADFSVGNKSSLGCRCGKPAGRCQCGKSGRWVRRGQSIVIIDC